ncbi:hypothetical protein Sj15T_10880 [Sphingobium sp. TA15]|nr:hypothetical protein Sj15T_10880 [Sphingobium sp. TA15]
MVRLAAQHACDARPAYALLARHRYIDAVRGKDLKHRLVWRYVKSLAGAGELDFKALVLGARGRRGRKILPVNAATAPAELTGSAQNEIEETRRTARIKMGIGTGRCQDGVHIEALLLWPIVEMKMRLFGEMRGRNPVEESRPRS